MTGKMRLYIGLLVLGVALIGGGLWLLFHANAQVIPEKTPYSYLIPDSTPLISANMSHVMREEFNFLSIYGDGSVVYIEEKGLRMPSPENPPTRTWKTGQLQQDELNSLLGFVSSSGFGDLEDRYKFPGVGNLDTGLRIGDMHWVISVNWGGLHKTVLAGSYLTPDHGLTYPDMPYPLNEIYKKLKQIANNQTQVVASETIKSSLLWE